MRAADGLFQTDLIAKCRGQRVKTEDEG